MLGPLHAIDQREIAVAHAGVRCAQLRHEGRFPLALDVVRESRPDQSREAPALALGCTLEVSLQLRRQLEVEALDVTF